MKVIFLDRDGVINRYPGDKKYVTSWRQFRFLPRVKKAISKLSRQGYRIFVISNQAGVGKGIFSQKTLNLITKNMLREIEKFCGKIEGVYYCTHRKFENCSCRKPKSGLIDLARKDVALDLRQSFFVGDTIRDVITAKGAGCRSILVLSGKEKLANRNHWEVQPDFVFKDLYAAVDFILKQ